mgnify:CR=1 FL=1
MPPLWRGLDLYPLQVHLLAVWVLQGLLGYMIPLADHLRDLLLRETTEQWWDRMAQTLCEAEMNGYGIYNVALGICYSAGAN